MAIPVELTAAGSRRDLDLPEGWSTDLLRELLSTISIDGAPPTEMRAYLDQDFERFVHTWSLVRDCAGSALEIGANPYFTTVLLREFTELELTLTNSFHAADAGIYRQRVRYMSAAGGDVDQDFEYHALNVEAEPFPFADASFDVVLFCEVIEHLLLDPVAALSEIHRVLKPKGVLVVTTPNLARLENVGRLAAGANIYDPYSGYGPYGRHNREFIRHELVRLLEFTGFDAFQHFTADVHAHATAHFIDPARLLGLVEHRLPDLGQYIFCRATKDHAPRQGRPEEMFRSMPDQQLVPW